MAEKAYGAVRGDVVGVFSGFMNHGDKCSLPGQREVSGGDAGGDEQSEVPEVSECCLFY